MTNATTVTGKQFKGVKASNDTRTCWIRESVWTKRFEGRASDRLFAFQAAQYMCRSEMAPAVDGVAAREPGTVAALWKAYSRKPLAWKLENIKAW
jgi:hypothetical protein